VTTVGITVRLFAGAREAAGTPVLPLELPDGATAGDVWSMLPVPVRNAVDPSSTRLVVNGAWCRPEQPLGRGDEVALITPVSGG
jgi:molybdopterin converting factor small subunit